MYLMIFILTKMARPQEMAKQLGTVLQATALIDAFRMGPAIYVACFQERPKAVIYFLLHPFVMQIPRHQEFKDRMIRPKYLSVLLAKNQVSPIMAYVIIISFVRF